MNSIFTSNIKQERRISWLFLLQNNIKRLPVDPFELAINNGWLTVSYEIGAHFMFTTTKYLIETHGKDGFVFYSDHLKRYLIVYNDTNQYQRIRFTLAHEIGHILFGHVTKVCPERHRLPANVKDLQDRMCDEFARRLLCPSIALYMADCQSTEDIMFLCNVSREMASNTYRHYLQLQNRNRWLTDPIEQQLHENFKSYFQIFT